MPLNTLPRTPGEPAEITIVETNRVWGESTAQLVDVRELEEWNDAHVAGAIHITLGTLHLRATELDKTRAVVAICHSGRRSLTAAETLTQLGFADVASAQGGMLAWVRAGYPTE